jgi:hypothetical protein
MAMNRIKPLKAAGALALAGIGVFLSAGPFGSSQRPSLPQFSQEANEIFQARCSTCHAEHGEGSEVGASLNVPDLRSPRVQKDDDAFLRQFIKKQQITTCPPSEEIFQTSRSTASSDLSAALPPDQTSKRARNPPLNSESFNPECLLGDLYMAATAAGQASHNHVICPEP